MLCHIILHCTISYYIMGKISWAGPSRLDSILRSKTYKKAISICAASLDRFSYTIVVIFVLFASFETKNNYNYFFCFVSLLVPLLNIINTKLFCYFRWLQCENINACCFY